MRTKREHIRRAVVLLLAAASLMIGTTPCLTSSGLGVALPVADALTERLRRGAGELLQQAVEAEVAEVIARFQSLKDEQGGNE